MDTDAYELTMDEIHSPFIGNPTGDLPDTIVKKQLNYHHPVETMTSWLGAKRTKFLGVICDTLNRSIYRLIAIEDL